MRPIVLALTAITLLAGCDLVRRSSDPVTPTVGQRVPVLGTETALAVDPGIADLPVHLPPPTVNSEWAQPGGNAAKSMGHLALADSPSAAWSVSIGEGSSNRARLASEPVIAAGRVYTIDTRATVRAFDERDGSQVWSTQVRGEDATTATLFGGGVSYDSGRIYATNGSGYAAALDAATGAIVWMVRPGGPLRGAPTIGNDNVYVISQDNQLFALDQTTGRLLWTGSGAFEMAAVFGSAAPAFAQSTVVAGFSSGELTAFRYENGRVVWQDALARTGGATTVGMLSDIDADPVIDNGRVFAVGQGGRMVAIELITGQRVWEVNIAGISTPWAVGEWVYVVNDQGQLLALSRAAGRIRWIAQLPAFRNPERRRDPIWWRGPVLAGNRLILTSSTGQIAFVSPTDGAILSTLDTRAPFSLAPVVANNTLYVLDDTGRLTAWR